MTDKKNNQSGLTYIEMIVVMVFFLILLSIITTNLIGLQQQTTTNTSITTIINDIKSQQTKAMFGDTDGGTQNYDFGVHFETGNYTLFRGDTYIPADSSNIVIDLTPGMEFSDIQFPGGDIIFDSANGEISAFNPGGNYITLLNSTNGDTQTTTLNRFGVITSVN